MLKKIFITILVLLFCKDIVAQMVYYPLGSLGESETYRNRVVNSDFNFYFKNDLPVRFLQFKNDTSIIQEIAIDETFTDKYLKIDNLKLKSVHTFKKAFSKNFYLYRSAFYAQVEKDYVIVINPVLNFQGGKEQQTAKTLFQNTRGAEIWGNIGGAERGVGFYSLFTENQLLMPNPYRFFPDSLNFVPSELFFKNFKKQGAVDFFQARAYFTFSAVKNYIKFQFGHDRHKIGNGYRSLILSDFAPQYLFFKINTDVKRLHYQNLFTQFSDNGQILGNTLFGKKYGAFHRLSFDVAKNFKIGVNEMVIFDRQDSTQKNQFDLNYLNPVIFYRAVESNLGSRDNSLMALDFEWQIKNKYVVYGQFLLDEFNLKFLKSEPNWWANKYAYQIGGRAFNLFGLENLDVLAEYNRCRPYTYSHYRTTQSYSHFNQPLAHPLGANFSETIFEIKYRPAYKWFISSVNLISTSGRDSSLMGKNYGGNVLRDYSSRATEFNSQMYMGQKTPMFISELMVSYMLKHNLMLDLRVNYRKQSNSDNMFLTLGMRLNTSIKKFDY
ncbi:MAG: hypothetical protein Q8K70_07675 [Bacteroidota bacterium]|nr:hypothetical protein [Bacteroidota bacterium]